MNLSVLRTKSCYPLKNFENASVRGLLDGLYYDVGGRAFEADETKGPP
jgi:hypothetical protein